MRTLLCHYMTQHMASTVSGLFQHPGKLSTVLSCFSLQMGLGLSIKFLFPALHPFLFTQRRIIYCFLGEFNIPITSTMRRAAFQNGKLCCTCLHRYLFPKSCKWMGKRKEDFWQQYQYFHTRILIWCTLKKRQLLPSFKK